jgi:pseudouridine synthase
MNSVQNERLQKLLSRAGHGSRRAAEKLIDAGRVTVNGERAQLGRRADPAVDDIRVDGKRIELPATNEYIMLNKPAGVISDLDVSGEHRAARDLIPLEGHLYPVGRLDLNSEGLMLFTNDGDLAHRLTHPRYDHPKTYHVLVEGAMSENVQEQWRRGVTIDDYRTRPAVVEQFKHSKQGTWLKVVLKEGRKRQIRRVAAKLGHPVLKLERVGLGPLQLGDLPSGGWRRLTQHEIEQLKAIRDA